MSVPANNAPLLSRCPSANLLRDEWTDIVRTMIDAEGEEVRIVMVDTSYAKANSFQPLYTPVRKWFCSSHFPSPWPICLLCATKWEGPRSSEPGWFIIVKSPRPGVYAFAPICDGHTKSEVENLFLGLTQRRVEASEGSLEGGPKKYFQEGSGGKRGGPRPGAGRKKEESFEKKSL